MAYNSSGNAFQRTTPVVLNLIIINGLVFAAQNLITQFNLTAWGSLYYYKSPLFEPYQFLTSMFMHLNLTHILFNMFGLWMFGTLLERVWGSKRFLIFYLICGLGAGVIEQLLEPYNTMQIAKNSEYLAQGVPLQDIYNSFLISGSSLGASGAIMGVFAAFGYLFPNTQLYLLFIPIPVKAKYAIPFFVLIDLFGGIYRIKGDDIGHFAHLGGALIGFILVLIWNRTNKKTFY